MTHSVTDADIVNMIRAGDSAKFELLVNRYRQSLRHVALRIVQDPELTEDLVQEALLLSFTRLGQLQDPQKYGPWLRSILRNACRMWNRRSIAQSLTILLPPSELSSLVDDKLAHPERGLPRQELQEAVAQLCLSLPRPLRATSYFFYVGGLSCKEISRALQVGASTIESRLYKARAHFRHWVLGRGRSDCQRVFAARLLSIAKEEFIVDALRLEISSELIPLVHPAEPNRNLLQLVRQLRRDLETHDSVRVPKIHVIDNLKLPAYSFAVYLQEQNVASGTLHDIADTTPLTDALRRAILDHRNAMSFLA